MAQRFSLNLVYNDRIYDDGTARSLAEGVLEEMRNLTAFLDSATEKVITPMMR